MTQLRASASGIWLIADAHGGAVICVANSVANGKIRRQTRFRRVYVQSAAGDAGESIGAAFAARQKQGGKRSFRIDHAYWEPHFDATEIANL